MALDKKTFSPGLLRGGRASAQFLWMIAMLAVVGCDDSSGEGGAGGGGSPADGASGGDAGTLDGSTADGGDARVNPGDGALLDARIEDARVGPPGDRDDDGVPDATDNCPERANNSQADGDDDGVGDACDNCPEAANANQADSDEDGAGDACDVSDQDGDGVPDAEDICPAAADPEQTDSDDDGIGDACDNCPQQPNFSQADGDGDGIGDACEVAGDDDNDGVLDAQDNCADVPNAAQADADDDGRGDACDNCPQEPNFSQQDADGDGVGDACDTNDQDGDGIRDDVDNCARIANAAQTDTDDDGVGDPCDNCRGTANPDQADADGDGIGDLCEAGDRDGDGVPDGADNCPGTPNANQADADRDGIGDVCERPAGPDRDEDGVPDAQDNCPEVSNENQLDTDGDGQGDACDAPGERTNVRITARWNGANTNVDLHFLHPNGGWFDGFWDVYGANPAPQWADPGLAQPGNMAPGPEVIVVEGLPPGLYQIGATFGPTDPEAEVAPASIEITVQCGDRQQVLGPQQLDDATIDGQAADLWQAATLLLPECVITPFPRENRIASTLCFLGFCLSCAGCQDGVCRGVDCPNSTCDLREGECIDPCAGINCPAGQACEPSDRQCYRTGAGQCDVCEADVQCTVDDTDRCLVVQATGERFCAAPCRDEGDCDRDYSCVELVGDQNLRYCAPDSNTCVDRCAGVRCPAGEVCDPVSGACGPPPCALNTDCPAGNYCHRGTSSCEPTGRGRTAVGGACGADADCVQGALCMTGFGVCARVCDDQPDCPANQFCLPEIFDQGRLVCASFP